MTSLLPLVLLAAAQVPAPLTLEVAPGAERFEDAVLQKRLSDDLGREVAVGACAKLGDCVRVSLDAVGVATVRVRHEGTTRERRLRVADEEGHAASEVAIVVEDLLRSDTEEVVQLLHTEQATVEETHRRSAAEVQSLSTVAPPPRPPPSRHAVQAFASAGGSTMFAETGQTQPSYEVGVGLTAPYFRAELILAGSLTHREGDFLVNVMGLRACFEPVFGRVAVGACAGADASLDGSIALLGGASVAFQIWKPLWVRASGDVGAFTEYHLPENLQTNGVRGTPARVALALEAHFL